MNVTVRGDALQKTGGCQGCDDAVAISRQMIRGGDGYVEFTPGETNTFWFAGLTHAGDRVGFRDIDFAFRFNGAGMADVMENGAYQSGGDTPYSTGDVFRIAVVDGKVQYLKNGRVLRESSQRPDYPLVAGVALGTIGATVRNAAMETSRGTFSRLDERSDRFARLDRNRDEVISLNEWDGSRRSFERLDATRDGVLEPFELMDRGESVGTSGEIVFVDPTQAWTNTGIYVTAGDRVLFDAEGTVRLSTDANDIATPRGSRLSRRAADAPLRQNLAGALIGRIGNSGVILIGQRGVIEAAPVSGYLHLGVNDDHLADNSGQYRVHVNVEPR